MKRNFKSVKTGGKKPHSKTGEMIAVRKKVSTNSKLKYLSMAGMIIDMKTDDRFIPNPDDYRGGWVKHISKHQNMLDDKRPPLGSICGRCGTKKVKIRKGNNIVLKCPHSTGPHKPYCFKNQRRYFLKSHKVNAKKKRRGIFS